MTVDLSVVIPMLNEAESLPELYRRLTAVLEALPRSYEIVFVDDGSTDRTAVLLTDLAARDSRVRGVRLAHNAGQHAAIMAGLRHAAGRTVVTLDADMQTPPEEIPALLAKLDEGFEVVFGIFTARHHPRPQRVVSAVGHALLERALRVPRGVRFSPFRALTRVLVDRVATFRGNPVQLEVLLCTHARRMGAVAIRHEPRRVGETKYTLRRRLRFALDVVRGWLAVRFGVGASSPQYVVAECIGFHGVDEVETFHRDGRACVG